MLSRFFTGAYIPLRVVTSCVEAISVELFDRISEQLTLHLFRQSSYLIKQDEKTHTCPTFTRLK